MYKIHPKYEYIGLYYLGDFANNTYIKLLIESRKKNGVYKTQNKLYGRLETWTVHQTNKNLGISKQTKYKNWAI